MFASLLHGTMANGMPSSIGLQKAEPGRPVVCMAGDGGISMLFGDVMTVVQQELPIKIAVYDNGKFGLVEIEKKAEGMLDTLTKLRIRTSPALCERWVFGARLFRMRTNWRPRSRTGWRSRDRRFCTCTSTRCSSSCRHSCRSRNRDGALFRACCPARPWWRRLGDGEGEFPLVEVAVPQQHCGFAARR